MEEWVGEVEEAILGAHTFNPLSRGGIGAGYKVSRTCETRSKLTTLLCPLTLVISSIWAGQEGGRIKEKERHRECKGSRGKSLRAH